MTHGSPSVELTDRRALRVANDVSPRNVMSENWLFAVEGVRPLGAAGRRTPSSGMSPIRSHPLKRRCGS